MMMSGEDPGGAHSGVAHLPLSDPRCVKAEDACLAFKRGHDWSQSHVSYYKQYDYGYYVAGWYCGWIFLAMLLHVFRLLRVRRGQSQLSARKARVGLWDRSVAAGRFLAYRKTPIRFLPAAENPSLGLLFFFALTTLFLLILTFSWTPYYREFRGYGSPPLAVRTGLMATALIPLLVGLAGKASIVSFLTGLGHEKLNVYHRWTGWLCFALSVTHTIPFIVAPLRDGGYAALHQQFYSPGAFEYTGVFPLAFLFGLLVFSFQWIRNRFHKLFYWCHVILAVAFVGTCFWHFFDEGDSWAYLWATLAIWSTSVLFRIFVSNQTAIDSSFKGLNARLEPLAGEYTGIDIETSPGIIWQPGQHFFLRFPSIGLTDNHPFTAMSLPAQTFRWTDSEATPGRIRPADESRMRFLVKSHKGFTSRLAAFAERGSKGHTVPCYVDGPYGGIPYDPKVSYDNVVLVAGGGGITVVLPWLEHILHGAIQRNRVQSITVKWVARHLDHISSPLLALRSLIERAPTGRATAQVYITRDAVRHGADGDGRIDRKEMLATSDVIDSQSATSQDVEVEKLSSEREDLSVQYHKPNFKDMLPCLMQHGTRNIIICCGPSNLTYDVSNAAADCQKQVLKGQVQEVDLFTECFGW